MKDNHSKAERVQRALSAAINEAFANETNEVLLNKWIFVTDLIIDGERLIVTVWDDGIHPLEAESLLRPALRLAEGAADSFTVATNAGLLDEFGIADDADMEDDDDY